MRAFRVGEEHGVTFYAGVRNRSVQAVRDHLFDVLAVRL
jgi:hypothetical protein